MSTRLQAAKDLARLLVSSVWRVTELCTPLELRGHRKEMTNPVDIQSVSFGGKKEPVVLSFIFHFYCSTPVVSSLLIHQCLSFISSPCSQWKLNVSVFCVHTGSLSLRFATSTLILFYRFSQAFCLWFWVWLFVSLSRGLLSSPRRHRLCECVWLEVCMFP